MSVPSENPRHYCRNCYRPLPPFARYCLHCGQKDTDGKINLRVYLRELIDTVFNVDSKFFRTIKGLFIPGKLTEAYFEGKHQRYATPLRLFFVTAVIHFAVINSMLTSSFESASGLVNNNLRQAHEYNFAKKLSLEKDTLLLQYPGNKLLKQAIDSLLKDFKPESDSLDLGYFAYSKAGEFELHQVSFALKDVFSDKRIDALIEEAGVTGGWAKLQLAQSIKFFKSGDSFPAFVLGKMIWMVLLMMPALALILKLLYIRRKRYFVEHLVFSYHYHAFAFIAMSIALLIINPGEEKSEAPPTEVGSGLMISLGEEKSKAPPTAVDSGLMISLGKEKSKAPPTAVDSGLVINPGEEKSEAPPTVADSGLTINPAEEKSEVEAVADKTDLVVIIIFPVILIYLFWAMRRVYKQRIFKTLLKFTLLNIAYVFIFTTALILTLLAGFLLF